MQNFIHGTELLFSNPTAIVLFIAGLLGGGLFGAIPGISLLTLGAIILPFTAYLQSEHAIMLYSVIYCSGVFGGAITAILFNIPGSPENAPTAFDGYKMTLNGQAGKAIGAAVLCSSLGGMVSCVLMMTATPTIAKWAVTAFNSQEVFALIFFGLTVAVSVGAKTLWKGWLSVLLGLSIATIGSDPAGGIDRFNFGTYYLLAGIHFIPTILGLFAVAEVFEQSRKIATGERKKIIANMQMPKFIEFWQLKFAIVRSIVIGLFAGILPGIGATLAAFLSYNEAIRWSKTPEKFGTGTLEGVVAPETANNTATGAAMIPLLALGLPGGALTAMMMGVFQIHGMEPGPLIFVTSSDLVWITFSAMFFANLAIFLLGYLQTKTVIHLLRIPFQFLAPAILMLATIGAFAVRNLIVDVWVMFAAAVLGFFLRRYGFSPAGLVLGLVLGDLGESSFVKSMQLMQYDWTGFLTRPISAVLIVAGVLTVITGFYKALRKDLKP